MTKKYNIINKSDQSKIITSLSSCEKSEEYEKLFSEIKNVQKEVNSLSKPVTFFGKLFGKVNQSMSEKSDDIVKALTDIYSKNELYFNENEKYISCLYKYIDGSNKTISDLKKQEQLERANLELIENENSKEYQDAQRNLRDTLANIFNSTVYQENLQNILVTKQNLNDSFVTISNSTLPSIMNTIHAITLNDSSKKHIDFTRNINDLNNKSLIAMTDNIRSTTQASNELLEQSDLNVETLKIVFQNRKDIKKEQKRHTKEMKNKTRSIIDSYDQALLLMSSDDDDNDDDIVGI